MGDYLAAVLGDAVPSPASTEPALDVRLPPGSPAELELWVDAELASPSFPASEAPARALGAINRWLCFPAGPLAVVHAGVAARRGRAVLLVGESGAGKSTLVAGLTRRGWTYVSDEAAGIDEQGDVHPYARPINLRPGSWGEFPELAGQLPPGHEQFATGEWHVPPALLGDVADTPLPVGAVVFVRHRAEEATQLRVVGRGETLERMTLQHCNLGYSAQEGMDRLARVAGASGCHELVFTDLSEALDALETVG